MMSTQTHDKATTRELRRMKSKTLNPFNQNALRSEEVQAHNNLKMRSKPTHTHTHPTHANTHTHEGEGEPEGQVWQTKAPGRAKVPGAHGTHSDAAPRAAEPARQGTGAFELSKQAAPAGHGTHTSDAVALA
jgi:hypothetical protein